MSDLRIALVAEGKTDAIILEAALKAFLGRPFVLTLLQPETSDPSGGAGPMGGGWPGVYHWCRQVVAMNCPVGNNPSLLGFDLILLHVDTDVAGMNYRQARPPIERMDLPCEKPCPPAADSVDALREVISRWLDLPAAGGPPDRWVFCNPSKCSETWMVAACFWDRTPAIMEQIECNSGLENWLSQRPIREGRFIRGRNKIVSQYRRSASNITHEWNEVERNCTQAVRFKAEVQRTLADSGG
jgi:hypothetical protein